MFVPHSLVLSFVSVFVVLVVNSLPQDQNNGFNSMTLEPNCNHDSNNEPVKKRALTGLSDESMDQDDAIGLKPTHIFNPSYWF